MTIGTGVVLFVIGAILVFALNFDLGGVVNIDVVGYILMAAGLVTFVIGLIAMFRRRSAVSTSVSGVDATGARVDKRVTEADDPTHGDLTDRRRAVRPWETGAHSSDHKGPMELTALNPRLHPHNPADGYSRDHPRVRSGLWRDDGAARGTNRGTRRSLDRGPAHACHRATCVSRTCLDYVRGPGADPDSSTDAGGAVPDTPRSTGQPRRQRPAAALETRKRPNRRWGDALSPR